MCGIVRKPTRRKHFQEERQKGSWGNMPVNLVSQIAYLCEETYIPERACEIMLTLASSHLMTGEKFLSSIPFAIYENGKRYVSEQSILDEQDVMHLAMAGSVIHLINQELKNLGLKIVMGHCCDIQMHSVTTPEVEEQCMRISHEANVWRATKLRALKDNDQVTLSDREFVLMSESQKNVCHA